MINLSVAKTSKGGKGGTQLGVVSKPLQWDFQRRAKKGKKVLKKAS